MSLVYFMDTKLHLRFARTAILKTMVPVHLQSYFFANASDAVNILKKRSGASVQLARENGGLPSFHAPGVRLARFARKITLTALRVFRAEKKNWLFCILIANGISC